MVSVKRSIDRFKDVQEDASESSGILCGNNIIV